MIYNKTEGVKRRFHHTFDYVLKKGHLPYEVRATLPSKRYHGADIIHVNHFIGAVVIA